jgi:sec-independent protein translocase protein TatB
MFDISWSEFLLIGVVALIVIGPKELPAVMRTLGHWMRKVRSMASEFQSQFQEAMREAEMADLKKEVDDLKNDVAGLDPLTGLRDDVESAGEDLKRSLDSPPEPPPALPSPDGEAALTQASAETPSEVFAMAAVPAAAETDAPAPAAEAVPATEAQAAPTPREMESVGAGEAAEKADRPAKEQEIGDGTGRTE